MLKNAYILATGVPAAIINYLNEADFAKVIEQNKCPHCGEVIREYEDEEKVDSCWGFYGDCLEDNGILDQIGSDLQFVED